MCALAEVFAPQKLLRILLAGTLIVSACATAPKGADDLDIAIRDTSDYLNDNIPAGNKIVILNIQSDYTALSEYIIDELIANAVNDKVFSVVDRAQLDAIRMELNFQVSGEVSDDSALEIGKFLGAQIIVSGAISPLADRHRIRIRALNVETAEVQGQYNRNINTSKLLTALQKGGSYSGTSYGTRTASGNGNRDTSGNSNASGDGTITGRGTADPIPSQPTQTRPQAAGAANGTYTFYPRARATQSGVPRDMYIGHIVVTTEYYVFYLTTRPTGDYYIPAIYGGNAPSDFIVQDLDNPVRSYVAVNAVYGGGQATVKSVSFRRFPATRFKLTIGHSSEPMYWEEINFEKAVYEP